MAASSMAAAIFLLTLLLPIVSIHAAIDASTLDVHTIACNHTTINILWMSPRCWCVRVFTETPPTPPHGTHPSPSTSISVKQAPTTNVSKASPTTGISTTPPELCPNSEEEYPLKSNNKESRRFRRYNHNNQHKQKSSRIENNDHCVNLSSCTLTKEETSVLNKGLGFVPRFRLCPNPTHTTPIRHSERHKPIRPHP